MEQAIQKYRKKIWEQQFVLKRITEIVTDLYRMVAVVSRASKTIEDRGLAAAGDEITMARAFCQIANRNIGRNFRSMDRNIDDYHRSVTQAVCKEAGLREEFFS